MSVNGTAVNGTNVGPLNGTNLGPLNGTNLPPLPINLNGVRLP